MARCRDKRVNMGIRVEGVQATINFVENTVESVIIGTAYELGSRFKERTPVDTGFAKNSWIISLSSDSFGTPGANNLDAHMAAVNHIKLGKTIYINNGADYIAALENGHSQQAPQGMVAVTLPEVSGIVNDQIRDARKKRR